MKKFVAAFILALTASANPVMADSEEVQLTDYRYSSACRGLYGYNFFNEYFFNFNSSKNNPVFNNPEKSLSAKFVILKPDGTEMFQSGRYLADFDYRWYDNYTLSTDGQAISFSFPQYENKFVLRESSSGKFALLNADGKVISSWDTPFPNKYRKCSILFLNKDTICFSDSEYILPAKSEKENLDESYNMHNDPLILINIKNGAVMSPKALGGYPTAKLDEDVVLEDRQYGMGELQYISSLYTKFGTDVYTDKEQNYFHIATSMSNVNLSTIPCRDFYFDADGNQIEKPQGVEFYTIDFPVSYYNTDNEKGITTDKIDTSYIFKEKNMGGRKYYALFKELKNGETEADYHPKEQPSFWAADTVSKATLDGLLFNNSNCRYRDNISRQDFCILAVEAFCKAQNMEVDQYINENHIAFDFERFTDTDNVYVLLANRLGIVSGTSDKEFSPDRGITRQEAAVMLNNIARLSEVSPNAEKTIYLDSGKFSPWAKNAIENISAIKTENGDSVMGSLSSNENIFSPWSLYSREQAYVTIYRLYEAASEK